MPPKHPRAAKEGSATRGRYSKASKPAVPSKLSEALSLDNSDDDSASQNTQVAKYSSGGIKDAILKGKKGTAIQQTTTGPSKDITAKKASKNNASNAGAKGEDSEIDTDTVESSSDEEPSRVRPISRAKSARQTLLTHDPRFFLKEQNKKNRRERTADAQAVAEAGAEGIEESDDNGSSEDDNEEEAGESEDSEDEPAKPTIREGVLKKAATARPKEKAKRPHRPNVFENDSAPDNSDFEGDRQNKSSFYRLWDSIDRHAKWCPFVRINKKIQNAHRRIKALEASSSSDDDDDSEEEDNSKAKAKAKTKAKATAKKAKAPVKKPAAKKAAPKKRTAKKTKAQENDEAEDADVIAVSSKSQHPGAEGNQGTGEPKAEIARNENTAKSNDAKKQKKADSPKEPAPKVTAHTQGESVVNDETKINSIQTEADNNDNESSSSSSSDEGLSSSPAGGAEILLAAFNREKAMTSSGEEPRHVPLSVLKPVAATGATGQKRKISTGESKTPDPATGKKRHKVADANELAAELATL